MVTTAYPSGHKMSSQSYVRSIYVLWLGGSLQYFENNFRKRKAEKMKLQKSQLFRLRGH